MNKLEVIEFLKNENTYWSSRSVGRPEFPFDIKPSEYLDYANLDISIGQIRGLVNALSNAKRALDCQMDSLLFILGLYNLAKDKNWNFPKKIDIANKIGILAPRILGKINKIRNLMEHEFIKPDEEQVNDFIDIVALFIASTDKYLYDFPGDGTEIESKDNENFITVDFNWNENLIEVNKRDVALIFEPNENDYLDFIKYFLKVGYEY